MQGTVIPVNKAMIKPLMIGGVEKRLVMLNALLSFPIIASAHFHLPAILAGVGLFSVLHFIFRLVSKYDPYLGKLFKRSTRYSLKPYFPAKSHP